MKSDATVRPTSDGSFTLYSEQFGQTYHSIHGARTESERVFLELGYDFASTHFEYVHVLEVGFGSGLNAWLTLQRAGEKGVHYTGLEAFPLPPETYCHLPQELQSLHALSWGIPHTISPHSVVVKINTALEAFQPVKHYHLVYFDAFSPEAQPELWTEDVFRNLNAWMHVGGVLTTYCSKGSVQRNLRNAGFAVEKHVGPPHKREVLRAIKL